MVVLVVFIKPNMAVDDVITKSNIKIFSDFFQEPPGGMKMFTIKLSRPVFTNKVNNCIGFLPWGPGKSKKPEKMQRCEILTTRKLGFGFQYSLWNFKKPVNYSES